jgi:hypothetical protein
MAEQHRHKLAPAGETACVSLGLMLLDGALEICPWEHSQQLRENAAYSIHGGGLRKADLILVLENQNPAYRTSAASEN